MHVQLVIVKLAAIQQHAQIVYLLTTWVQIAANCAHKIVCNVHLGLNAVFALLNGKSN